MEELESQIAKIQIGNGKTANSYVYIMTEQAQNSPAELYVLTEMPLLNPAAAESCEKISLAIAAALKRTYRRQPDNEIFEHAIAQINEELAKLANLEQMDRIEKLNCIIGVKLGQSFTIATTGKVAAFLYRNREFTDISCSNNSNHPLKTFENFAVGKLKLGDLLILSTTQLFNHVAMERMQKLLSEMEFLPATQTIIEIAKKNAGPEVAFGSILNLQVEVGQTPNEEIDLEEYAVNSKTRLEFIPKIADYFRHIFLLNKNKRIPNIQTPKINTEKFKTHSKKALENLRYACLWIFEWGKNRKSNFDFKSPLTWPIWKKILAICIAVSLMTIIIGVILASHNKKLQQQKQAAAQSLQKVEELIGNAESSLVYKEDLKAIDYLNQAEKLLPEKNSIPSDQQKNLQNDIDKIAALKKQLDKLSVIPAAVVGSFGNSGNFIKLPNLLAVQLGSNIVSYNKNTGQVLDGSLKSSEKILANVAFGEKSVVYNGTGLLVWDYLNSFYGNIFTQNVPQQNNFAGLAFYSTNNRVYTVNKSDNTIISFAINDKSIGKPIVANKDSVSLTNAQDIAIDGNIYVLTDKNVIKFTAGKIQKFDFPYLTTPYSGIGKIAAQKGWKYIYILDIGNSRILILDTKGSLVKTLSSPQFTKIKDFQIDEQNKIAYVLNDSSLLKLSLP